MSTIRVTSTPRHLVRVPVFVIRFRTRNSQVARDSAKNNHSTRGLSFLFFLFPLVLNTRRDNYYIIWSATALLCWLLELGMRWRRLCWSSRYAPPAGEKTTCATMMKMPTPS